MASKKKRHGPPQSENLGGNASEGGTGPETSEFALELSLPMDQFARQFFLQRIKDLQNEKNEFKKEFREERDENKKLMIKMQDYVAIKRLYKNLKSEKFWSIGLIAAGTFLASSEGMFGVFPVLPVKFLGIGIVITTIIIGIRWKFKSDEKSKDNDNPEN
ncbi:MAG: hypothetical protein LBR80_04965 [Deltaproteobacteria bacterium]|jgi:hypothetical protein|nr:hypothetical protein [Deltaproteobacteria bacterium]